MFTENAPLPLMSHGIQMLKTSAIIAGKRDFLFSTGSWSFLDCFMAPCFSGFALVGVAGE